MLQHTIRFGFGLRFTNNNRKVELAGAAGVRGEIGVAAVGVAVARATERRFINQAFVPALFARGDGSEGFTRAQAVVRSFKLPYALWCFNV